MTYTDAPRILNWEDSICKHPRVFGCKCWVCGEEFEGYSKEFIEEFQKRNGWPIEKKDES